MVMLLNACRVIYSSTPLPPIVLGLAWAFVNVDSQEYHSAGSNATLVSILGKQLPRSSYNFSYSIDASVQGTAVSGGVRFELHGGESAKSNSRSNSHNNNSVAVAGPAQLVQMVPALVFAVTNPTEPLAIPH